MAIHASLHSFLFGWFCQRACLCCYSSSLLLSTSEPSLFSAPALAWGVPAASPVLVDATPVFGIVNAPHDTFLLPGSGDVPSSGSQMSAWPTTVPVRWFAAHSTFVLIPRSAAWLTSVFVPWLVAQPATVHAPQSAAKPTPVHAPWSVRTKEHGRQLSLDANNDL